MLLLSDCELHILEVKKMLYKLVAPFGALMSPIRYVKQDTSNCMQFSGVLFAPFSFCSRLVLFMILHTFFLE